MTDQKRLKQRVRERMARTGERWAVARMHVLAERERVRGRLTPAGLPDAWVLLRPRERAKDLAWLAESVGRGRSLLGWSVPDGATRVGADGAFDLPAGGGVLLAGARGHGTVARQLDPGAEVVVGLAPSPAGRLVLEVRDTAGRPARARALRLRLDWSDPLSSLGTWDVVPLDARGCATLELAAGEYVVVAEDEDAPARSSDRVPFALPDGATTRVPLVLREAAELATVVVRTVDAAGAPLAGVALEASSGQRLRDAGAFVSHPIVEAWGPFSDADGRHTFRGWDAGTSAILARLGGLHGSAEVTAVEGRVVEVTIPVVEPIQRGDVHLRLLDAATGAPVRGGVFSVALLGPDHPEVRVFVAGASRYDEAYDAATGQVRLLDLPLGRLELRAWGGRAERGQARPGDASYVSAGLTLDVARGVTEATLLLQPAPLVALRLLRPDGAPAGPAQLTIGRRWLELPSGAVDSRAVDDDGVALLDGVAPGEVVTLEASELVGHGLVELELAAGPGEHLLRLPGGGPVLRVLDPAGAPLAGATVDLPTATWWRAAGTTDAAGRLCLHGQTLPAGQRVVIRSTGLRAFDRRLAAPLAPGETLDLTLEPLQAPGALLGRVVDRGGAPVRAAWVSASSVGRSPQGETTREGTFRLAPVHPGPVKVEAKCPDRGAVTLELDLAPGEVRRDLTLELPG